MELTFNLLEIDTIEVHGDEIWVFFYGTVLKIVVERVFFDNWLKNRQRITDLDSIYLNQFELYVKEYLKTKIK